MRKNRPFALTGPALDGQQRREQVGVEVLHSSMNRPKALPRGLSAAVIASTSSSMSRSMSPLEAAGWKSIDRYGKFPIRAHRIPEVPRYPA
uniref:Uncharacterized protein n=1 Tax=Rhodococcus sp. NS1 TaxID=402236 RepID=A0A097SQ73_9NOCA|nr:hypothetical protein LRS1606.238 [Rhodococcus sp. NS1]